MSAAIVGNLKLGPTPIETEDLAVGSSGLLSRRERDIMEPQDTAKWTSVAIRRNSTSSPTVPTSNGAPQVAASTDSVTVWLPKDRTMVQRVLDVYFTRLNIHRPVLTRASFERSLDELYGGASSTIDPGLVCSVYLVLALGTLSELNERINTLHNKGQPVPTGPYAYKEVMPGDWPTSEEFFDRALAIKPDLRVTISSLQALILLHWYLYTEVCSQPKPVCALVSDVLLSDRAGLCGASLVALSASQSSSGCTTTPTLGPPYRARSLSSLDTQRRRLSCASAFGLSFSCTTVARPSCWAVRWRSRPLT